MSNSSPAKPKVVAHRGASSDAPENTMAAFSLAWEQGADVIECDIHATKDQQLVCIHDSNTKRTADRRLNIATSTLQELRALDAGSWKSSDWKGERIPTLTEVLTSVPEGKMIFVEIKAGAGVVPLLPAAIESSGIDKSRIVIISFDNDAVSETRKALPNVKAFLLVNFKYNQFWRTWKPSRRTVLRNMKACGADGVDVRACPPADEKFFKAIRHAGGEVHVWTVNDPETATRFIGLGADSITTDRPGLLRSLIDELQKGGK